MTDSWKIGAISGLIAGLGAGIVWIISVLIVLNMGLTWWAAIPPITPITKTIATEILVGIIWGIISGVFYVKLYDLIPGKGFLKGLFYGLGIYLIFNIRLGSLDYFYGNVSSLISWICIGFFSWIFFGLILEIIYEFLCKTYNVPKIDLKIIKRDTKGGIYSGAIAGLVQGLIVFFGVAAIFNPEIYPKYAKDIGILIGQLGTHLFFNMVWGIVFGIIFALFYKRIPREGILKGLIFGMVIYFLSTFRGAILLLSYASPQWFLTYGMGGLIGFLIFGLVLGYLYRKPSE